MRCERARDRIGMQVDGELPETERDAVTRHVADCPECARYRAELMLLRRHLAQVREPAPAKLAARLSAALAVEASSPAAVQPALPSFGRNLVGRVRHGLAPLMRQAAVILIACALSAAGTAWWMHGGNEDALVSRDVLSAHLRSLIQGNTVQVASLDTHTVKPWFAGRLDYSPAVKNLSAEGFELVGGRLDYVDGQRVAVLVYKRRLHQISVFIWPGDRHLARPYAGTTEGLNVIGWTKEGMSYWAVSDLNDGELRQLQSLL